MSKTPNSAEPNEIFETLKRHGMSDIPHDEFVSIFYPSLQDAVEECAAKGAQSFAEWIWEQPYKRSSHGGWYKPYGLERIVYTTAELYQLYKEGKG